MLARINSVYVAVARTFIVACWVVLLRASLNARRTLFSTETNGPVCSYAPCGAYS